MANPVDTGSLTTPPQARVIPLRSAQASRAEVPEAAAERQVAAESGNTRPAVDQAQQQRESAERLREATRDVSDYIQTVSRSLQISVDNELGSTVVQVFDAETEELIRQIPAEEVLEIARYLRGRLEAASEATGAAIKGLLVDREG